MSSASQVAAHVAAISATFLADVNWSVRLINSSSKSSHQNEPRVLLQLRLLDKTSQSDDQNKWVTLELNQAELAEFIDKLQQTSTTMHALSK